LLEGKTTKVDSAGFDTFVGDYEIAPNFVLTVTKEGDKLFGQATGQGKLELEPVSEDQFAVPSAKAMVVFEKNSEGKIAGLVLSQGGRDTKAKKIK
jgi:hypothetical protein